MKSAPIHRDALALCGVLLEELDAGEAQGDLRRHLGRTALGLLDEVSLAVSGFERRDRLREADAALRCLRTQLALAHELGVLAEEPFLDLAEQADLVGRQIGGWLKKA